MKEKFIDKKEIVEEKNDRQDDKRKETINAKKEAKLKLLKKNQAQFLE